MALIQCLHLRKHFTGTGEVFRDVNLEVCKGEFVYLTGPGGAGKSTFLRLIAGLDPLDGGYIIIDGRALSQMGQHELAHMRRRMGIVVQSPLVMTQRTVAENIALPLRIAGKDSATARKEVDRVLRLLNLEKISALPCLKLSETEKRVVAFARAVVADPVILLVDDPLCGLDDRASNDIMEFLTGFHKRGATVIVAAHATLPSPAAQDCRVMEIRNGKLLETGFFHQRKADLLRGKSWPEPADLCVKEALSE